MWFLYIMEHYSAKKNEMLQFATPWMDLEGIRASLVAQTVSSVQFSRSVVSDSL